jgi:exonuclease SbcC
MGDAHVSDEAWIAVQQDADCLTAALRVAIERLGTVKESLAQLQGRRAQWLTLEADRVKLADESERVSDLRLTLRGNSFVEFLAREQLDLVARDASDRLSKLTRGRYALEVLADGGFAMRDLHNGGIRRPVSTLSGGETFLTSLALALALSSQIQLRGQYPLQFFFLDEGFGTLDPELLDVVISTLEHLHHERMTIGLISHVPELRHRLQRRLIVEPAEPAGRGSRVKVEMA